MQPEKFAWRLVAAGAVAISACASDGAANAGSAETRAGARHYADRTAQVATPSAGAEIETGEATTASVGWKADVITAASPRMAAPDTITRASEYRETRHEGSVGLEWKPRSETVVDGSYTGSIEPDTVSHTGSIGWRRDLFARSSTLLLNGRLNHLAIGAVDRPEFARELWIYGAGIGWAQILNPELLTRIDYTLEIRDGYQANPYRYVPIWPKIAGTPQPRFALREELPRLRFRHAWALSARWSVTTDWFLHGSYRFYIDDWAVRSHTLRTAIWWEHPQDWLRIRLFGRGYTQAGARLYESRYTTIGRYRSGDYRLSSLSSVDTGLRTDLRFSPVPVGKRVVLSASYDLVYYWLPAYPVFDSMLAHVPSLSFRLEFP